MTDLLDRQQFERVALAVAATVALHVDHLPAGLSFALAATIAPRVITRRRAAGAVSWWVRVPLTVFLLMFVSLQYGNIFGRVPGTALACGMLALKLLEAERTRDARVALGFASFVLMSSLLFTQTLLFSLAVCGVLGLVIAGLLSLQPAPLAEPRRLQPDLWRASVLLGIAVPLALAAFVLLPRLNAPLWGTRGDDTLTSTGLSDSMAPGQFVRLMLDESPAFRAEFKGPRPRTQSLYFRTIVLSDFDGTTWTRRFSDARPSDAMPQVPARSPIYDYTVTLEGSGDRRWLPALDLPIVAPEGSRLSREQILVARPGPVVVGTYDLQSSPDAKLDTSLPGADRARLLALPPGYGKQARELARRWRDQLRSDDRIVEAALKLFHSSFDYTLEPPPLARDTVDDFLFGTKAGFCEHYASAFVFLMRAAGIPARVVTGYQGGWWSSEYLLVRQSDAHAWAEVWSDGEGWKRVDPTAAVSPDRIELGAAQSDPNAGWMRSGWLRELRNQLDIANSLWTRSVISFDSLRQHALLTEFGASELSHGDLLLALSIVLALTMALAAGWAMWDRRVHHGDPLDRAWQRFRAALARGGIDERTAEGPLDLRARVHAAAPASAPAIDPLVDEYVALRYGSPAPEPLRVARLVRRLRAFRLRRR
ncbi:DUF3488 and transglutaminase-like domain-containing protein [Dokdonella sp.]|uniref:transglutaminase TgpA family protein n=1 Tax=Dokdonella sp. TaxID=2291710 RepID=UPI002F40753E